MLGDSTKLWMAIIAACGAALLLIEAPQIQQGTGLVAAALATGSGWLIRELIQGQHTRVSICQAYAALIETHYEEFGDALSDAEIDRILALYPKIRSGEEKPSIGSRTADPFRLLPDIRPNLHLLSPQTVRLLWKWQSVGTDLFQIYDQLGSKEMAEMSPDRLIVQYAWVRKYRDEYRRVAVDALKALMREAPTIKVDTRRMNDERSGAS